MNPFVITVFCLLLATQQLGGFGATREDDYDLIKMIEASNYVLIASTDAYVFKEEHKATWPFRRYQLKIKEVLLSQGNDSQLKVGDDVILVMGNQGSLMGGVYAHSTFLLFLVSPNNWQDSIDEKIPDLKGQPYFVCATANASPFVISTFDSLRPSLLNSADMIALKSDIMQLDDERAAKWGAASVDELVQATSYICEIIAHGALPNDPATKQALVDSEFIGKSVEQAAASQKLK